MCRVVSVLDDDFEHFACSELTVHRSRKVQSSIMANKNSKKESEEAILREIKEEMAKPRVVRSARKPGSRSNSGSALLSKLGLGTTIKAARVTIGAQGFVDGPCCGDLGGSLASGFQTFPPT